MSWKTSFQNAIADFHQSATEELDLLLKHLGKKSAEQVKSLRSVNIRDHAMGLFMVWGGLDETFGSPEAVEHALFSKLEKIPKVTTK